MLPTRVDVTRTDAHVDLTRCRVAVRSGPGQTGTVGGLPAVAFCR